MEIKTKGLNESIASSRSTNKSHGSETLIHSTKNGKLIIYSHGKPGDTGHGDFMGDSCACCGISHGNGIDPYLTHLDIGSVRTASGYGSAEGWCSITVQEKLRT